MMNNDDDDAQPVQYSVRRAADGSKYVWVIIRDETEK